MYCTVTCTLKRLREGDMNERGRWDEEERRNNS